MKKVLICIPTYNRSKMLYKQLKNLTSIDNNLFDIVIFDNCSNDDTKSTVEAFCSNCNNITYLRNKSNVGYNGNILNIVEHASKQSEYSYLFILSDDDLIFMKNFISMCDSITTSNELLLLTWLSSNDKGILNTRPDKINLDNIYEVINKTALISSYMYPIEFIRNYNIPDFVDFSENTFLHIKIIVDCVKNGYKINHLETLIGYEAINFEWRFDLYQTFCLDRYEATQYMDKILNCNYSKQTAIGTSNGILSKFIVWHSMDNYKYDKFINSIIVWKFKKGFYSKGTFLLLILLFIQKIPFLNKLPYFKKIRQRNIDGLKSQELMIKAFSNQ